MLRHMTDHRQLSMQDQLFRDADVLWFGEKAKGFFATFAADAALFHSPERDAQISQQPAIHPDGAGVDSFGDAVGAAYVLCPDA